MFKKNGSYLKTDEFYNLISDDDKNCIDEFLNTREKLHKLYVKYLLEKYTELLKQQTDIEIEKLKTKQSNEINNAVNSIHLVLNDLTYE